MEQRGRYLAPGVLQASQELAFKALGALPSCPQWFMASQLLDVKVPPMRDARVACLTEPTPLGFRDSGAPGRQMGQSGRLAPRPQLDQVAPQAAGRHPQRETQHHAQKAPLHPSPGPHRKAEVAESLTNTAPAASQADPQQCSCTGRGPRREVQRVLKEIPSRRQHGPQPVLPAAGRGTVRGCSRTQDCLQYLQELLALRKKYLAASTT